MNAYSRPQDVALPTLSPEWVRRWIEQTQDLVILLDAQDGIAGVIQNGSFATADVLHWMGQALRAIVSIDTQPKVRPLLDNDVARADADTRWRHLNLLGFAGNTIPVLMRYMRLNGPQGPARVLCCRDLRGEETRNNRFIQTQQELETSHQSLRANLTALELEMQRLRSQAVTVDQLVARIKQASFAQVIEETHQSLQRRCLQSLLNESAGDHDRAAALAHCTRQEWADLVLSLGLR